MTSAIAKALDSSYNRMQWSSVEYLLEEVIDTTSKALTTGGEIYSADVLY